MGERSPSIQEQAEFLNDIVAHCTMLGGAIAGETLMSISGDQVRFMKGIADRLVQIAPHEDKIRRIVLQK